jgi:RimJ/RimL family protein N-acetyltransferase
MQISSSYPPELLPIRQATVADAAALRELRLEALQLHPEAFGSDYEKEAAQPAADWVQRLSSPADRAVFVAEGGSRLVGMTGIYRSENIKSKHNATIWGVYVRPAWRGQGIAQHLVEAGLDWARQQGLKFVKLAVVTTNVAAIRAYQKMGFRVYGVDPAVLFHAQVYYDELLMACAL